MTEVPVYAQLSATLRDQITSGTYAPGQRLPTEAQLMDQYKVSRNTVRAAVGRLVDAGLVTRRRGSGCYVTRHARIMHSLGSLRSLTDVITDLGLMPGIRNVSLEIDPQPSPELRGFLQSEPVWVLRRTRTASGTPFAVMDSWLPDGLGRSLNVERVSRTGSLYRSIAESGHGAATEATESISAEAATLREARELEIPVGSPVLVINRFTTDRNGQPIEYGRSAARGDLYRYWVKLKAISGR